MTTHYADIPAYATKDGSIIRELMHPAHHDAQKQSLAEATVPVDGVTHMHVHEQSEELYHVTAGSGRMHLGGETFGIAVGDTVCIRPGVPHAVENTGDGDLIILCCCSPAYSHDDTQLVSQSDS